MSSKKYLENLIAKKTKFKLSGENTKEDFYLAVFSLSIFDTPDFVICENFLDTKKVSISELKKIPDERNVVFWEEKALLPAAVKNLQKIAKVQIFKRKNRIYDFLDYLSPNAKESLKLLIQLEDPASYALNWQLTFRVLLLTLQKIGVGKELASKLTSKPIQDWQWEKIANQAKRFDMETLIGLYNGLIRADFAIKTGQTSLSEKNLFIPIILKYLSL